VCEGTMEGNITAETFGDGDFVSRITVGPKLKVLSTYLPNIFLILSSGFSYFKKSHATIPLRLLQSRVTSPYGATASLKRQSSTQSQDMCTLGRDSFTFTGTWACFNTARGRDIKGTVS